MNASTPLSEFLSRYGLTEDEYVEAFFARRIPLRGSWRKNKFLSMAKLRLLSLRGLQRKLKWKLNHSLNGTASVKAKNRRQSRKIVARKLRLLQNEKVICHNCNCNCKELRIKGNLPLEDFMDEELEMMKRYANWPLKK